MPVGGPSTDGFCDGLQRRDCPVWTSTCVFDRNRTGAFTPAQSGTSHNRVEVTRAGMGLFRTASAVSRDEGEVALGRPVANVWRDGSLTSACEVPRRRSPTW